MKGNALEVKTMNRQQRRRHEQLIAWVNSLSKDKQTIIDSVIRERAADITLANMVNFQMSFSAALITLYEDKFNMNDIQELIILANRYAEDKTYINRFGDEWVSMFEKQKENMKKEMTKLFEEGVKSQNAMVKFIKKNKDFKDIPQKDIVVVFKELKDEIAGIKIKDMEESKLDVDKALDYIFSNEKKEDHKKEIIKEEIKEDKEMSKLKVLKKEITLEGEFGVYTVDETGLKSGEKHFKDIKDIDNFEKEEIAALARRINELKSAMAYI